MIYNYVFLVGWSFAQGFGGDLTGLGHELPIVSRKEECSLAYLSVAWLTPIMVACFTQVQSDSTTQPHTTTFQLEPRDFRDPK